MKYSFIVAAILSFCISCKEQEARRPKQHSTTNFYKELIEKNKRLNAREQLFLESLMKKDSLRNYLTSSSGFWYYYHSKDSLEKASPKPGELVTIRYAITDIYDVEIYPEQEKKYKVDKQDFIPALQDGIKLMKEGETITFLIPSYRAFGVLGDQQKIGVNQPIKCKVRLVNINTNNDESK